MKLLYVTHEMNLGGATRSLLGIIDEMILKGHKVFVLVPKKEGELIQELEKREVKIVYCKYYPWMSMSNTSNLKVRSIIKYILNRYYLLNIVKKIKPYKIDVIHTNSLVMNIGGYLKKRIDAPHVWHIREFGEEDLGITFNFDKTKSLKVLNENADKVIVISNALKKKYETYIEENKLLLIYNGVSKGYLQRKSHSSQSHINILISGSLIEGKGQEEAILAINLLKEKHSNITLNIAGRGSTDYTEKLQSLVRENNLENYVKFLGYIHNISDVRKSMDIELVCSKSEAFGRVTVEAMMSMNPVIASDTGANPELIKENFNGLLYRQGDYYDLASKIEILVQKPELIAKYGENGYNYAKENFTAESNANSIEAVYKEILAH